MDETWQRHKTFIVQCVAGGFVFLIALLVKGNMYGGVDDPQEMSAANQRRHGALSTNVGPTKASIREQQEYAKNAEDEIRALAGQIASLQPTDAAYVRENIDAICAMLGQPGKADGFFGLYETLPQTCLTSLQGFVRDSLVGRAAQDGKELDESMGISASFQDDEVAVGIHGLMLVTDVVSRCLDREDITGVEDLNISAGGGQRRAGAASDESSNMREMRVRMTIVGDPDGVRAVLVSFNSRDNKLGRAVVLDKVSGVHRPREADDTIKASFTIAGLWYVDDTQQGDDK